jgi:hypothetical protein
VEAALDVHASFLAALLALVALHEGGEHSAQTRFVDRLTWPERWTVQPICSNVELTVACLPLTDILSDDGGDGTVAMQAGE